MPGYAKRRPIHALGSVAADGTKVNAGSKNWTSAKTATGKYTITFDAADAIDATEGVAVFTPRTATDDVDMGFVWTSDTVLTIETWAVGAAADAAFDFVVFNTFAG